MTTTAPSWGLSSRFYIPNEDAAVVRAALSLLGAQVRRPVFVGGSGMVLLEAASALADLERATFVDISMFQVQYFQKLVRAINHAESPESLRAWFCRAIYPALQDHYRRRGRRYLLGNIIAALSDHFGLDFFFKQEDFLNVQHALARIDAVHHDIVSYLAESGEQHDFVYLSNVPDYLPESDLKMLFESCWARNAPVYLLLTGACENKEAVKQIWESAGYVAHPSIHELNCRNRGLGSATIDKRWNRQGFIWLLFPGDL